MYSYFAGSREELRAGGSFNVLDHWSSSHRRSAYFDVQLPRQFTLDLLMFNSDNLMLGKQFS